MNFSIFNKRKRKLRTLIEQRESLYSVLQHRLLDQNTSIAGCEVLWGRIEELHLAIKEIRGW